MHISFLGLGHMGRPMAQNLLGLGHTLTVYNRTPGKAKALIALGAREATTVSDAVKYAEVSITMFSDDAALENVAYGPSGLLQHLPSDSIHLCMSTLRVETSAKLALSHAQAGQGYVAAPIFGKAGAVASRQIWILAGGPESQVNRCLPIFVALGRGLTRVGPNAPLAHALKLSGNVLTVAMEKALSELVLSCEQAGMAPADYLRFLNTETFKFPLMDAFGGAMAHPSFDLDDLSLDHMALLASRHLEMGSEGPAVHVVKEPLPVSPVSILTTRAPAPPGKGPNPADDKSTRTDSPRQKPSLPMEKTPPSPDLKGTAPARMEAPQPKPPLPTQQVPALPDSKGAGPTRMEAPRLKPPLPIQKTPTVPDPKGNGLTRMDSPRSGPPLPAQRAPASAISDKALVGLNGSVGSHQAGPSFTVLDGKKQVILYLDHTSHFEEAKGQVQAWSQGRPYDTSWHSLGEVESAFSHVLFLRIQPRVLLRPEATLDLRPTFGGGARARVGENLELKVSRSAAPKLKELLGL